MDLRKLKTLIDLVAESGITELEITEGDGTVRIVKSHPAAAQPMTAPPAQIYAAPPAQVAAPAAAAAAPAQPPAPPPAAQGHVVKAPMVGTFYRAANPGASPFVEVGQAVKEGQALCIIEAMKLLNEIETDVAGVVKEVLVENGEPVEYGQPLFVIG
jgi:acetyl-CoA carboxylase biotin carboxyl carrier protein